jgi:hypothetical protein
LLKGEHDPLSPEWLCFGQFFCLEEEPMKHGDFLLDAGEAAILVLAAEGSCNIRDRIYEAT